MRKTLVLLAALLPCAARADAPAEMARAVEGFYGAYASFHPSDGIPDVKGRAKYQPFVSPALETLLVEADRAEEAFAKANKGSPPMIEGDLFTSNFEGATLYKVSSCSGDARKGRCAVALTYDPHGTDPKDKPVAWTDTVNVVATPQGWKVDDIAFGATWEFGNKGSLVKTLQDTIANVGANARADVGANTKK